MILPSVYRESQFEEFYRMPGMHLWHESCGNTWYSSSDVRFETFQFREVLTMNSISHVIIGLWILPVAVNIFLPLIILILWLVILAPAHLRAKAGARTAARKIISENRCDRRIHADELRVTVSDGVNLLTGLTCNISRLGICIMGLPDKLAPRADHLAVTVDRYGETYSLQIKPRWEENVTSGKRLGAVIEYAPSGWNDFVRKRSRFMAA